MANRVVPAVLALAVAAREETPAIASETSLDLAKVRAAAARKPVFVACVPEKDQFRRENGKDTFSRDDARSILQTSKNRRDELKTSHERSTRLNRRSRKLKNGKKKESGRRWRRRWRGIRIRRRRRRRARR